MCIYIYYYIQKSVCIYNISISVISIRLYLAHCTIDNDVHYTKKTPDITIVNIVIIIIHIVHVIH